MNKLNVFGKRYSWVIAGVFGLLFSCQAKEKPVNNFSLADLSVMQFTKNQIDQKDPKQIEAYNKLIKQADQELGKGPYSVMNKKLMPPSNDKHNYLTLAPYFWPNPDTPDHLPYIRKDGEVNPETRNNDTDYNEVKRFFNAADVLGKAYFYSKNGDYADKAILLLKTWFVNPETKMNPNLNFGQGVRGLNDGRPFGIIEFGGISNVITCLDILKYNEKLDPQTESALKKWLADYAEWMKTSKIGTAEGNTKNNHGSWYDVQLCSIYLYLGDTATVRGILEAAKLKRIAAQIEPDGSQPMELERTKSFSYSIMNLNALTQLAAFGNRFGIDLWNYETSDGRGIKKAYEYFIPYIANDKKWEYQQLGNLDEHKTDFVNLLEKAGKTFNEERYSELAKKYGLKNTGHPPGN